MAIDKKLIQLIAEELDVEESEVTQEASFIDDLGADSLDIAELLMKLEEEFDVNIPDDEAEGLITVGKVAAYLAEKA